MRTSFHRNRKKNHEVSTYGGPNTYSFKVIYMEYLLQIRPCREHWENFKMTSTLKNIQPILLICLMSLPPHLFQATPKLNQTLETLSTILPSFIFLRTFIIISKSHVFLLLFYCLLSAPPTTPSESALPNITAVSPNA